MSIPQKASWLATYDDRSDKVTVSYDTTSEHCAEAVSIEYGGDQWVYVAAEDAAWVAARLLDAAAAIAAHRTPKTEGEG